MQFKVLFPIPPIVYGDSMAPIPPYYPDLKGLPDLSYVRGSYACVVCRRLTGWSLIYDNMSLHICSTECLQALATSAVESSQESVPTVTASDVVPAVTVFPTVIEASP